MKRWTAVTVVLIALGFTAFPLSPVSGQTTTDWVTLLDAAGMANWTPIGDANWHVEDGSVQADKGSGFLVSKESLRRFPDQGRVLGQHRSQQRHLHPLYRTRKIATASAYEVNIFDTRPDRSYGTGAIVNVGKASPMLKAGGQWNVYEIHGQGFEVLHHAERHDDRRRRRGRQVPERADRAAVRRRGGEVPQGPDQAPLILPRGISGASAGS